MLTPKTNSQTFWQRAMSHVMNEIIFAICSFSACSALPAAPKQYRKGCHKEQEKRELWQSRSRRWTFSRRMRQALLQRRVRVRENVRGYSVHPVSKVRISQHYVQGNLPLEVQIKNDAASSSQAWLPDAKMNRQCVKTHCCKNEPGSEFSRMCKEACRRKFRYHRRRRLEVAAQLPHISCWRSHTSRKSTRICDSNLIASQKTKWKTSMWIR